ncbi:MAG: hypothetical protein J6A59_03775 [Lachnospiraceae bacterium]|nr:hypothetical protein [Lachnospiraceae bacterium]
MDKELEGKSIMKYYDLLKLISERKDIPTYVMFMGMTFKLAFNKEEQVIDYYCNGEALTERISLHILQAQADIELEVGKQTMNIWR